MRKAVVVLTLAALALAAPAAGGAQQNGKSTSVGVKGILLMPGQAYIEEADAFFDIDMSFGVGGMVDTRLGEKILGGLFLDLLNISAYDESATMIEAGVALKAMLGGGATKMTWRPGIGFGYGILSGVGVLESTNYFTVRGSVEAVLPSHWVAEAMVWGAPSGGNDQVTVTYGPMFQLRFGRVF